MPTRLISFAQSTVAIEYSSPIFRPILDFLYPPPVDKPIPDPHVTFQLSHHMQPYSLEVSRGKSQLYHGDSLPTVAEILLGDSCYHLVDKSQNGLLFHAAGVEKNGQGILMPGSIGAGKSTLTAWLLTQGCNYLSDELTYIPTGSEIMHCFARPLNLKPPARPVLHPYVDISQPSDQILSSPAVDLVSPLLFKASSIFSQPPLSLIIFPHYQADSDFALRPLSKAQAGLALMQCLVNARNLSQHGFPEITSLVARVPAYQLQYTHFDQINDSIEQLLSLTTSLPNDS